MYDAFPLLLALAVLHFVAVALIEHRFVFRPLLYVSAGILLGMLINPYFPHNLIFSYHHMLPKLARVTAVRVGNEWYPYDTKQLWIIPFQHLSLCQWGYSLSDLPVGKWTTDCSRSVGFPALWTDALPGAALCGILPPVRPDLRRLCLVAAV